MAGEFSHVKNNEGSTEENFLTDTGGIERSSAEQHLYYYSILSLVILISVAIPRYWSDKFSVPINRFSQYYFQLQ